MGSIANDSKNWEAEAEKSRDIRTGSIQKQWLLKEDQLPSPDRLNVRSVPVDSGILSSKEIEITGTDATGLVKKMGAGIWTAEEVVVAFLKRGTIAHQLVSYLIICYL